MPITIYVLSIIAIKSHPTAYCWLADSYWGPLLTETVSLRLGTILDQGVFFLHHVISNQHSALMTVPSISCMLLSHVLDTGLLVYDFSHFCFDDLLHFIASRPFQAHQANFCERHG